MNKSWFPNVSYRFPWKIMISWRFSIHGPRSCATIGISMPRRGGGLLLGQLTQADSIHSYI
jgi:hypothetical protein